MAKIDTQFMTKTPLSPRPASFRFAQPRSLFSGYFQIKMAQNHTFGAAHVYIDKIGELDHVNRTGLVGPYFWM